MSVGGGGGEPALCTGCLCVANVESQNGYLCRGGCLCGSSVRVFACCRRRHPALHLEEVGVNHQAHSRGCSGCGTRHVLLGRAAAGGVCVRAWLPDCARSFAGFRSIGCVRRSHGLHAKALKDARDIGQVLV